MNKTWWEYVQSVTNGATNTDIAAKVGIDKSAITRWRKGSGVDPLFAVKFARAYGRPVTEALWKSGLITEEEADLREVKVGISGFSDIQLAEEIMYRSARSAGTNFLDDGMLPAERYGVTQEELDASEEGGNVIYADNAFSAPRVIPEIGYVAGTDDSEGELDRE